MFDPVIIRYQVRDAVIYWLLIPAVVILTGKGIDMFFGLPELPLTRTLVTTAVLLLAFGLILIWRSMHDFDRAGGTPNPLRPPKRLVTRGSYGLCRHPMFLGYDMCALGVVLLLGSPGMITISFPLFIFLEIVYLRKEEHILRLKFKESYDRYRQRTSFLLPFRKRKLFSGDKDAKNDYHYQ